MYIESLYIESFAALREKSLDLSEGLNIIDGANESGKSSICMFIKFMLYGLSGRGADGEMSERQKYVTWDTGRAAGTITVVTAKGTYKITRELLVFDDSQPKERLEVIDLSSGEKVFKGKVPGVCILGLDEQMFVNTVFVRQIGGAKVDGAGMTEAIENILLSGDENLSLKKAVDRLDKARKALMPKKGSGGRIPLLMQEEARLSAKLEEARSGNAAIIAYESEVAKLSSLIEQRSAQKEKYTALCTSYEKICRGRRVEEARKLTEESERLTKELSELERYGNIAENSARINALSARLAGIDARLRGLRRSMGEDPDPADSMTAEEILFAKKDIANAAKLAKAKKTLTVLSLVMLVTAVAVLAGAFLLRASLDTVVFLSVLGVGALFALCFVILAVIAILKGVSLGKIYKKWSARDISGLERVVEEKIVCSREYDRAAEERARRDAEIYDVEEERAEALSALRSACLVFTEEGLPDTDILVVRSLEAAAKISEKREKLSSSLAMTKGELRGYTDVLGDDMGEGVLREAESVLLTDEGRAAASFTPADAAAAKNKKNFAEGALPGLLSQKGDADSNLARARATTEDSAVLAVQLEGIRKELAALRKRLAGIEEAKAALLEAGEGLRSSLVPRVVEEAGSLMGGFTDGKYDALCVDRSFSLDLILDGRKRELAYMSAGTADAAYISLRCALVRVLFSGDVPPLVYDESFARIDEDRLFEILSLLAESDMQSLVFTCRSLEGAIAGRLKGARTAAL